MRQLPGPLLASVALALCVATVVTGGSYVAARSGTAEVTFDTDLAMPPEPDAMPEDFTDGSADRPDELADPDDGTAFGPETEEGTPQAVEVPAAPAVPQRSPTESRPVAPDIVAQPQTGADALQWEAPREPLSQLSLALPPKPKPIKDPVLFRPVAVESAVVEAMGRRVAIAGVQSVGPDETCVAADGATWPCGASARTAFRLWLRGRALTCDLPDDTETDPVVAPCRMGAQDAGAWLVANGWARAVAGGAYVEAQQAAEQAGKGIFGPAPDRSNLPAIGAPATSLGEAPESGSILAEPGAALSEPAGGLIAPGADPTLSVFPPAPPQ